MFKKVFKNLKINFVTGLIIGVVLAGSGVYAVALDSSNNVTYDNSTSKASSTNVQDALDELYDNYNSAFFSEPRYEFGTPTASSSTDFKEVISSSGSKSFVKRQGNQLSVCLYYNEQLLCLKNGAENWETNQKILTTTIFSGANCGGTSSDVFCYDIPFYCGATSDGKVACEDRDANFSCGLSEDDTVNCD